MVLEGVVACDYFIRSIEIDINKYRQLYICLNIDINKYRCICMHKYMYMLLNKY